MSTRLLVALAIALLASACQTAMSIEEAKRVTTESAGGSFVPPPHTINDITAILDQQKRVDPEAVARARALVDQPPPAISDADRLADFYHQRGLAAREIGRFKQELDDLSRAAAHVRRMDILRDLSDAHVSAGNLSRAREIRQEMLGLRGAGLTGWQIHNHAFLARLYAIAGDLEAAEAEARESVRLLHESRGWQGTRAEWVASWESSVATAQASVLEARGRYVQAERFYRESISTRAANDTLSKYPMVDFQSGWLALLLVRQGRLLEAENEARKAVLGVLSKRGRNSKEAAGVLRILSRTIAEQGRYAEAETLARMSLDIYAKIGAPADSFTMALARAELAAALVGQGRWQVAVAEYDAIRRATAGDPQTFETVAFFGVRNNHAIALLKTGNAEQAIEPLTTLLERLRTTLSDTHTFTAEARGLLAAADAARGERARAVTGFAEATRVLLDRTLEVDDEATTRPAREQRLRLILGSYISLLASIRGTADERQAGIDATSEAFRLAEVARGTSIQRSLDAAGARAAAKTPALADLVRREQDARKQISALYGLLAGALTSADGPASKVVDNLRAQTEALRRARRAILQQIEREFPAYAQLISPRRMTLEQARSRLRSGEALVSTFVDDEQTFVWAVPHTGPVAFAAAPLGRKALADLVTKLRTALDPGVKTLGQIPDFDLALAHRLYTALLEPVAEGWRQADSLLIVADGTLGQLPFGLLPTRAATLGPEQGPLFTNYKQVPWLIRSRAVTVLPSVTALATLRAFPSGDTARRPFVGFGDPVFSREQAANPAEATEGAQVAAAFTARGRPLALRSSPKTQQFDSSRLAMLPRLPDTAEEVRSIALALNADLTRDVFVGARANEKTVKSLDLTSYRVLAFATHGLVPGDLDGLTQPALALSAPEAADVDSDGLLTMEEILGLRLNADWIVLSACNTASGQGAGSEAVSGLGRAFFYAGARALLVSNWPVETTSARELTTDVFRRQKDTPGLTRAKALQEATNALITGPGFVDRSTNTVVFSYAHPIFWAAFTLVGDGGGN